MTSIAVLPGLFPSPSDQDNDWRKRWQKHLRTADWQIKRAIAMIQAGGMCQMHGCANVAAQVHHRTYDRLGNENISDLMALCRRCHEQVSGKPITK